MEYRGDKVGGAGRLLLAGLEPGKRMMASHKTKDEANRMTRKHWLMMKASQIRNRFIGESCRHDDLFVCVCVCLCLCVGAWRSIWLEIFDDGKAVASLDQQRTFGSLCGTGGGDDSI